MNKILSVSLLAALALAIGVAGGSSVVYAAITCENPGGNAPTGQQGKDACSGGDALTNVNPAGNEPSGFNK